MNTFGRIFRISIFGESHGIALGITIDGCPSGINLCENDFLPDLLRRKAVAEGTTPRKETDLPKIISGTYKEKTTGAPITILFENNNTISSDYNLFGEIPRPGHADFTATKKFKGYNDPRGGGHFSGRITLGLVAAGVVAKKIIHPVNVISEIIKVKASEDITTVIRNALDSNDSVGGIIQCTATNIPVGLGEPFFDSVESLISHLVFSIPAVKGIEFGAGFNAASMTGSEHNDSFVDASGKTATNNAGGINGGITNGNDIVFRIAVKPTSSIGKEQQTFNFSKNRMDQLLIKGRHDTCIALRVPVVVEAATAIALADLFLLN